MRRGTFLKSSVKHRKMADLLGRFDRNEQQMQNLAKPDVRRKTAALIDECKAADSKALDALKQLAESM